MGLLDVFKSGKAEPTVVTILIKLRAAEDDLLFILLARDGTVNRMGTGSEKRIERDMFIGKLEPAVFAAVEKLAPPIIAQWIGGYATPEVAGKTCYLEVAFRMSDGKELHSQWKYGSQSEGPPPEVVNLVMLAGKATHAWYEAAKSQAASRAR